MASQREWKYLERDPKSSLRQLSVKGRRIRARTLYAATVAEEDPMTPEQVAEDYNVPLEAVMEAIEYCESKPKEIEQDLRCQELICEAAGMNHPDYKYNTSKHYRMIPPEERARIYREAYGVESES